MQWEESPPPRPAATLVILRDAPELEVLVTLRPAHLRFMGGATVFPGGAVAPEDLDPRWAALSEMSPGEAAAAWDEDAAGAPLGPGICALREAFEEVRFPPSTDADLPDPAAVDPGAFLDHAARAGARIRTGELVAAGRWVTPLGAPVRFDARFFLIASPRGWEPKPDPAEVEACEWIRPHQALEELAGGLRSMAPPTVEVLQKLSACSSVEEALATIPRTAREASPAPLRLSPLVQVLLAPNPGPMTGPGTNTYVVGHEGGSVVVDPAVDDGDFVARLHQAAPHVTSIVVTHRHADHTGGVAPLVAETGAPVRAFGDLPIAGVPVVPLEDGEVLPFDGGTIRALHTPGHASDHLCFLLEDAATLFSGDTILGEGTAVIAPPDGNMAAYMATLRRLRDLHIDRIFPGHWRPVAGGRAVIEHYIAHREARAEMIRSVLTSQPRTLDEIVERVYVDTPIPLHEIAKLSALAHLEMMQEEGAVSRAGDSWVADD